MTDRKYFYISSRYGGSFWTDFYTNLTESTIEYDDLSVTPYKIKMHYLSGAFCRGRRQFKTIEAIVIANVNKIFIMYNGGYDLIDRFIKHDTRIIPYMHSRLCFTNYTKW